MKRILKKTQFQKTPTKKKRFIISSIPYTVETKKKKKNKIRYMKQKGKKEKK